MDTQTFENKMLLAIRQWNMPDNLDNNDIEALIGKFKCFFNQIDYSGLIFKEKLGSNLIKEWIRGLQQDKKYLFDHNEDWSTKKCELIEKLESLVKEWNVLQKLRYKGIKSDKGNLFRSIFLF